MILTILSNNYKSDVIILKAIKDEDLHKLTDHEHGINGSAHFDEKGNCIGDWDCRYTDLEKSKTIRIMNRGTRIKTYD